MVHALELEEIRCRIGLFLSSHDLDACSKVCLSWGNTFRPMLWHHVTLDRTRENARSPRPLRTPSIHTLNQHASLIRSFTFKGPIPSEFVSYLPNKLHYNEISPLISLSLLNAAVPQRRIMYWSFLAQLVMLSSSTLQEFSILDPDHCFSEALLKQFFIRRPSGHVVIRKIQWGALRHLTLSLHCVVYLETWNVMLEIFQQLESLELGYLQLNSTVSPDFKPVDDNDRAQPETATTLCQQYQHQQQARFPHLRWIKLTYLAGISSKTCLNLLVAQSPSLQSLCWTIRKNRGFSAREFYRLLKAGTWPRLEALEIYGRPIQIPDHLLAAILNVDSTRAGKQATFRKLCVPGSKFGSMAMTAVLSPTRGHTKTLRELDLCCCSQVSRGMTQNIIAGCPRLEVFNRRTLATCFCSLFL